MIVETAGCCAWHRLSFLPICIAGSHDNTPLSNFAQESTELDSLQHDMEPCGGFRTCFSGVATSFWFLGEVEIVHVIQGLNTEAVQRVVK